MNGIGSGFVPRLSTAGILLNFLFRQLGEAHPGRRYIKYAAIFVQDTDTSVNRVFAPGQYAKHPASIFLICGLSKDVLPNGDNCIRAQDNVAGFTIDGPGLCFRETPNERARRFPRAPILRY